MSDIFITKYDELPSLLKVSSNLTQGLRAQGGCNPQSCSQNVCILFQGCTKEIDPCPSYQSPYCPDHNPCYCVTGYSPPCDDTPAPTKVSCTKVILYDDQVAGSEVETGLTPGATFTPELHMPSYDSSSYVFDHCNPSGAMTCPDSSFFVYYYFVHISVTCTKEVYYDNVYSHSEYETGLWPGATFTPDADSHIPTHSSGYEFDYCSPSSFPNGCPNTDFTVKYYFIKKLRVWVYSNTWKEATPWVYSNGWKEASPHLYAGGAWNPE